MNGKNIFTSFIVAGLLSLAAALLLAPLPSAQAQAGPNATQANVGTAFTYQARLSYGGSPANGHYDFQFKLFNAASGGSQVGNTVSLNDLPVTHGQINVQLDFGTVFDGTALWLEIAMRPGNETGAFTVLAPRQSLTATPYAVYATAAPWSGLKNVPAGFADGVDDDTTYGAGTGLALSGGAFSIIPAYQLPQHCNHGQIARWDGSAWTCAADADSGGDITAVNAGTGLTGGGASGQVTVTLETTYRLPQFCAHGQIAEWNEHTHAWVCGNDDTGANFYWRLDGNSGTNPATNFLGTTDNQALELRVHNARALRLEPDATSPNLIGGYNGNRVTGGAHGAFIGGGGASGHVNQVSGNYATLGGGYDNLITATYGTIAGGYEITVTGSYAAVGGGRFNIASGHSATVGGGNGNTASGDASTVGGGMINFAKGFQATVCGGDSNVADGMAPTVGGGSTNAAYSDYATVSGGFTNYADDFGATVSGGIQNTASGGDATVGGGGNNTASGDASTVGGGWFNRAAITGTVIGGGESNLITNTAKYGVIAGGYNITVTAPYATVPGGYANTASGDYSFAAGHQATAAHGGTFVWSDSGGSVTSQRSNQFLVQANGGARFQDRTGLWVEMVYDVDRPMDTSTGAYLSRGGTWTDASDRNAKENFQPVDPQAVLEGVAQLPITTWNYKTEDPSVRHLGPVAQDFYAAFGLGADDKHIAALDSSGVALAAIQGLYAQNRELAARNAALEAENAAQQAQLDALTARLEALEKRTVTPKTLFWPGLFLGGLGLGWVVRRQEG